MRTEVLEAIRRAVRSRKGSSNFVTELTDEVLWDLFLRLRAAERDKVIARWLHNEHGVGANPQSVTVSLGRLKKRLAAFLLNPMAAQGVEPSKKQVNAEALPPPKSTDLEEMDTILEQYGTLIHSLLGAARETGHPHRDLSKHAQAFASLSKARLKMEEAAHNRPPNRREYAVRDARMQTQWEALTGDWDDEERNSMIDMTQRFLERVEKEVVVLKKLGDGPWTRADREQVASDIAADERSPERSTPKIA